MNALEIAALGMQSDMERLQSISQNLANVSTPGFKRIVDVRAPFGSLIDSASAPQASQTSADLKNGAIRQTGRTLDLSVDAGVFVELRSDKGTLAYSRGGSFQLDATGRVVSAEGDVLQLMEGDLQLRGSESELRIDAQGEVFSGSERLGRLRLVRFDAPQKLRAVGGGRHEIGTARITEDAARAAVRTGSLESSNVQSTQEMVRLLETSRHFEAMQKVVQGYDEVMEKAIRKLGEV